MKKLLFLLALLPFMSSCSSDDEGGSQTFFVNVYKEVEGFEKDLYNQAFVYLYEAPEKSIDNEKSAESVVLDNVLTFTDGTTSKAPKYRTSFQPGVFNMEGIENGEYILWVTGMADYGGRCHSSYKKIKVNSVYDGTIEEKVFKIPFYDVGALYKYQAW